MRKFIILIIMVISIFPLVIYAEEYNYYEPKSNIQVTIDESIWEEASERNKSEILTKNDNNIINYFESDECGILMISELDLKDAYPELDSSSFNSDLFKGPEKKESLNTIKKTLKKKGYKVYNIKTLDKEDPIIIHSHGTISSAEQEYISDIFFVVNNGYLYSVEYQGLDKYKCNNNIKAIGESISYYDETKNQQDTSNSNNTYSSNFNGLYFIIDLIITIFGFMIYPFIRIVIMKKIYTEKTAKRMILWNSIIVGIIFFFIVYYTTGPNAASFVPAYVWYLINESVWVPKFIKQKENNTKQKSENNDKNKTIICDNCGAIVKENDKACPKCGLEFEDEEVIKEKPEEIFTHREEDSSDQIEEFICDNCGSVVKETDKACPNCGLEFEDDETIEEEKNDASLEIKEESQEELVCSNCGHSIKDSDKKCPHCGEVFEEEQEEKVEEEKKIKEESDIDKKYKDLTKLKKLLDKEIITKEEFEKEKKKILK